MAQNYVVVLRFDDQDDFLKIEGTNFNIDLGRLVQERGSEWAFEVITNGPLVKDDQAYVPGNQHLDVFIFLDGLAVI